MKFTFDSLARNALSRLYFVRENLRSISKCLHSPYMADVEMAFFKFSSKVFEIGKVL